MPIKTLLSKIIAFSPDRTFHSIVRAANEARDRKDWHPAAELYAQAITINPGRNDLRVQLGHMLKESGDLDGAECAYLSALERNSDDADLHLQLGHLRKVQGDLEKAREHYDRARTLQPENNDALAEYLSLLPAQSTRELPSPPVEFDVETEAEAEAPTPEPETVGGISSIQKLDISLLTRPVISFDLFDTLLRRRFIAVNEVHDTVSAFVLAQLGCFATEPPGPLTLNRYRTTDHLKASPYGPNEEPSLPQVWEQLIGARIRDRKRAAVLAQEASSFEYELDVRNLAAVPGAHELLGQLKAAGKTIIAVSDMYFSRVQIEAILDHVGLRTYFDHIFVSCEEKLTKQTGRLFEHALKTLSLEPSDVVHIGDNPRSDVEIPRCLGIQAIQIDQPELLRLERPPYGHRADIHHEIADLLKLFVFQMMLSARSDNVDKLYFLSRDGCLINRFLDTWCSPLLGHSLDTIPREDLFLSRSTCCWLEVDFTRDWLLQSIGHAFWLRLGSATPRQISAMLGISETPPGLADVVYRSATDTDRVVSAYEAAGLAPAIRASILKKRNDLERYLDAIGFFDHHRVIICDVGYSGTVIRNLNAFFLQESSRADARQPPRMTLQVIASRFNYFDNAMASVPYAQFSDRILLPHDRMPKPLTDNFAWLEMFFKNPTLGPLLGYTESDGTVRPSYPVLPDPGASHPSAKVLNQARADDADVALLWMAATRFWDQVTGPIIERFNNPDESTINQMLDEVYEADAVSGLTRSIVMIGDGMSDEELYRAAMKQDYWIPGSLKATALARSNPAVPPPVDLAFYRTFYDDLAGLTDIALTAHYKEHGRQEGRYRSRAHMLSALAEAYGPLPADFNYTSYLWANPDLVPHNPPQCHAELHYLKTGHAEGRRYHKPLPSLDEEFADRIGQLSIVLTSAEQAAIASGTPISAVICARYGTGPGPWLDMLNLREFVALNGHWTGSLISKADAVMAFLKDGIARLAPLSLSTRFDPGYYRQVVPLANLPTGPLTDADMYRHWLTDGCLLGYSPSEAHRLEKLLGITDFPLAFHSDAFYRLHPELPAQSGTRSDALATFLRVGRPTDAAAVNGPGEAFLWEALGRSSIQHSRLDIAKASFRKAIAKGGPGGRLWHQLGDLALNDNKFGAALAAYQNGLACPAPDRWSVINAAKAAGELHAFDTALDILQAGESAWKGMIPWRRALADAFKRWFETRINQIDNRQSGQSHLADESCAAFLDVFIARLRPFCPPISGVIAPDGPIAILTGNTITDAARAAAQNRPSVGQSRVIIFARHDIAAFEEALIGASEAVFHDIELSAELAHAILLAQSYGQRTTFWLGRLDQHAPGAPDLSGLGWTEFMKNEPPYRCKGGILSIYPAALCDLVVTSNPGLVPALARLAPRQRVALTRQPDLTVAALAATCHFILLHLPATEADSIRRPSVTRSLIEAIRSVLKRRPTIILLIDGPVIPDALLSFGSRVRLAPLDDDQADPAPLAGLVRIVIDLTMSQAPYLSAWASAALAAVPAIITSELCLPCMDVGKDVIVADTPTDLETATLALLDNPDVAAAQGKRAQAVIQASIRDDLPAPVVQQISRAPSKPRILYANVFFPPQAIGGATRVLKDNIDHLLEQHAGLFDLAVFTSDDQNSTKGSVRCEDYRGIPVFRIATPQELDMDWRGFNAEVASFARRILELYKPDLVHIHCLQRLSVGFAEACRIGGYPYVVTLHDAWWIADFPFLFDEDGMVVAPAPSPLEQSYLHRIGVAPSIRRAARLREALSGAKARLSVSENFTSIYRQAGFEVETLANGVSNLEVLPRQPATGSSLNRVRIGHVGGTQHHKGAFLIEAVLRTYRFQNLHFTVVELAWDAGAEEQTVWGNTPIRKIGKVPSDQIANIYANLDVLIAPSIWPESFGLVTREAAAAGLWLIASDQGAMAEPVIPGQNGFIIEVGTIDSLVTSLQEIDANPARFKSPPPIRAPMRTAADQGEDLVAVYKRVLKLQELER